VAPRCARHIRGSGAFGLDTTRHGVAGFNYAFSDDVTNTLSVYSLEDH